MKKHRAEFELREGDLLVCEGGEIGRCAKSATKQIRTFNERRSSNFKTITFDRL